MKLYFLILLSSITFNINPIQAEIDFENLNDQFKEILLSADFLEASVVEIIKRSAEEGDPSSQYTLGSLYQAGAYVPRDYAQAFKWYQLSADQADGFAQGRLGDLYSLGYGVERDYVKAYMWHTLAIENGRASPYKKNRGFYQKKMTAKQLKEAKKLIAECKKTKETIWYENPDNELREMFLSLNFTEETLVSMKSFAEEGEPGVNVR